MAPTPAGSGPEELRRANLRAVLRAVHTSGPTSRADLTRLLGVNRSTVGALTSELVGLGLVAETDPVAAGRSGRPSPLVVPCPENAVVAIDLGVDRAEVALVGLGGEILARRHRPHERGEHDVERVVSTVARMVEEVLAAGPPGARCLGVGVSVPGAVRAGDGLVQFAPNLGWTREPFTDLFTARLGGRVVTGNDANLGMLAEHRRGAARGHRDAAYLSGSVGIGGGFLVAGRLLAGAHGYAGEVGHLQVDSTGPDCRCGATGCWETLAGENRLLTLAGRPPGGGPAAVAEVTAAASAGEPAAAEAVASVAAWCGRGLRAIINVFNPEVIVLGGSLAQVWRAAAEVIDETVRHAALLSPREDVLIRPAALGQDSSLVGAAELAFEAVLEDPQGVGELAQEPRTRVG